jgi:hypothetical protein
MIHFAGCTRRECLRAVFVPFNHRLLIYAPVQSWLNAAERRFPGVDQSELGKMALLRARLERINHGVDDWRFRNASIGQPLKDIAARGSFRNGKMRCVLAQADEIRCIRASTSRAACRPRNAVA